MEEVQVGLLTIGQSPRDDIIPEIRPLLLPHIEIVEYGMLDGLSPEEIYSLSPDTEETPLVSRLRNGDQVKLGEKKISDLLPQIIENMSKKMDVKAVGVLCTHEFPKMKLPCPTVFPFFYLQFLIHEVLQVKDLGVVVPLEEQVQMAIEKWGKEMTVVEAKSPYTEGKAWKEISEIFAQKNVNAVILDCIGYRLKDRQEIQKILKKPILLPRTILAFAINQLF